LNRWTEMYKEKLTTIEGAINKIKNGDKIMSSIGNGQPRGLCTELAKLIKQGNHRDLYYFNTLNVNANALAMPDVASLHHYCDAYATPLPRKIFAEAIGEYYCTMFSDGVRTLGERFDTVFCTVSPMDKHGYFSLGMNPDYTFGVIRGSKKRVFVEVNEKYPRTCGNNYIHISEVDTIVENTWDPVAVPVAPPSEIDMKIAGHIAELVPDGACLQLGIGGTPNAVGKLLENKKDLGIHSEMICDAFLHLYKKGAINNSKKNFMPYRGIGTFTFGSKELYEWITENPGLEMWGSEFVNDPRSASKNDNLIAVNGIVEADLTGQCVSEEVNGRTYSGLGGQQDFTLSAWYSKGGKAFLTLASTHKDKDGKLVSNIMPKVTGTVGMNMWNTHYIVTEYGAFSVKGKTIQERVKGIIGIAHPDFRDELTFEAKKRKLII
jgi:4-hydroxybutyrate CoA-transferase